MALTITAEYRSINSELQVFRCISGTDWEDKIERSVYNRRKRKLFCCTEKIRETLSCQFSGFTAIFVVDSTPVAICKMSRVKRSSICSTEPIKPEFGYAAAQKTGFLALNFMQFAIKTASSISFDFSPANVHDVNDLHDIKETFQNCLLIGDRAYISKTLQVDVFHHSGISLSVPMRKNQQHFARFSTTKSKIKKRIETNISPLCGEFSIHIRVAKKTFFMAEPPE